MPWAPTATQLLDLDGVRRRADRFRFELYVNGQLAGELSPDLARPPTVKVDTGRAAVRTLDGFYLPAGQAVDVNTLADRVRAVMVLQDGTEYSLGWFMWGDDSRPRRGWGAERSSTLVDEGFRLDQQIDATIGYAKGTSTLGLAEYLVAQVLGYSRIRTTPDDTKMGAPPSLAPGSNRYQAAATLLASIGYLPPYLDRDNFVVLRPAPDMSTTEPALTYGPGPRVVADSIVESDDLLDAPNRFVVNESSGQGPAISGRYDVPDTSPHSINNRGGVVVSRVESQNGLTSVRQAEKAARTLALTDGAAYRYVTWQSPADPRHDVWDAVEFFGDVWAETSWSFTCRSGGLMTHEARRAW